MIQDKTRAVIAGTVMGVLVDGAMVATRYVIAQTDPASLTLLRYSIGTLGLIPAFLMIRRIPFQGRDILPVALLGIGQFGILIALLNYGLQFVGAGLGALLFAYFPLMTTVLAASLRLEAFSRWKVAGVLLTILGVGFAVSGSLMPHDAGPDMMLGIEAVLAAALTGAVCSVFYRPYLQKYPPL